ncbi:MAG: TlpA disulfide reductase family protein [Bacteroidales bacterium]
MKKIILCALAAIMAFSCATAQQKGNLNITGDITGMESGAAEVYLASIFDKKADSVAVEKGKFTLSCNIDMPIEIYLYIKDPTDDIIYMTRIFTGAGDIIIKGEQGKDKTPYILNSPINDEAKEYDKYIKSLPEYKVSNKLSVEISEFFMVGDKIKINELSAKKMEETKKIIDSILSWKGNALTSQVAIYYVCEYASSLSLEDQIAISNKFPSEKKDSYYLNEFRKDLENEKKVAIGCVAPNFKVKDLAGKEYTMNDFKGKYLFLEFSASWCGWCKKEIPFVRSAYTALKDKNIVFVTMNMDDKREKWEKDVTKENIEWLCLSNLEGMKSKLAQSYNIHGIPACYVIDPNGVIIKRDIRGNEVLEYLSSLVR